MKKVFISLSFNNKKNISIELNQIKKTLSDKDFDFIDFTEKYHFKATEEKKMMKKAFKEINKCSLLIAEVSDKAIGVGIEIGYAKAKKIPVIYLRNSKSNHSTTASGTADEVIIYKSIKDLDLKLSKSLKKYYEN